MAEYEYHPDICSACFHEIALDAPVAIIDEVVRVPRYYHEKCLFEKFAIVAINHGYSYPEMKKRKGG